MLVVCINDKWVPDPASEGKPHPKIGDKDIVVDIMVKWGKTFYILEVYPKYRGFLTTHFVDLPEPDADELKEAEHEAIVNLETA